MVHARICRSENERDEFLRNLKIAPCPHCKMVGFLNRHGFVRGFQQGDVKNITLDHLTEAFGSHELNPVAAFQVTFQTFLI